MVLFKVVATKALCIININRIYKYNLTGAVSGGVGARRRQAAARGLLRPRRARRARARARALAARARPREADLRHGTTR